MFCILPCPCCFSIGLSPGITVIPVSASPIAAWKLSVSSKNITLTWSIFTMLMEIFLGFTTSQKLSGNLSCHMDSPWFLAFDRPLHISHRMSWSLEKWMSSLSTTGKLSPHPKRHCQKTSRWKTFFFSAEKYPLCCSFALDVETIPPVPPCSRALLYDL